MTPPVINPPTQEQCKQALDPTRNLKRLVFDCSYLPSNQTADIRPHLKERLGDVAAALGFRVEPADAPMLAQPSFKNDLWKLGYAPGDYIFLCTDCELENIGDKRAWRCEQCAQKRLEANKPAAPVQPQVISEREAALARAGKPLIEGLEDLPAEHKARTWVYVRDLQALSKAIRSEPSTPGK